MRDNDLNSGVWWTQHPAQLEPDGTWRVKTNHTSPADEVELVAVVTAVPYVDSSRVFNLDEIEIKVKTDDGEKVYRQPFQKLAQSPVYKVKVARQGVAAAPPAGAAGRAVCPAGNGLFVLYYGSDKKDFERIRDARPNFVVVGEGLHGRPDIPEIFHRPDPKRPPVRVLAYVKMGYGVQRPEADVDAEAAAAMKAGYDGVFFDETDDARGAWNRDRVRLVKEAATPGEKLVIVNPGKRRVAGDIFEYADIVSVENAYGESPVADPAPAKGVPPWRWLAVQGDPAGQKESLAAESAAEALKRLSTFRSKGGFWYYSPARDKAEPLKPTHVVLPDWLEAFAEGVRAKGGPGCKPRRPARGRAARGN